MTASRKKAAQPSIAIQRAYDEPTPRDGYRVLVDRFWPRGRSKVVLALDEWARDLAPSPPLIAGFHHEHARWEDFRTRYRGELAGAAQRVRLRELLAAAGRRRITLIYGARSEIENQAVVLREALLAIASEA